MPVAAVSHRMRAVPALVVAAVLAAGCASVDLGSRYEPPPVRMPGTVTAPAAPATSPAPLPPASPMSQPVPPSQPQPQPLPPFGQAPLPPPPAPPPAQDGQPYLVTLTTRLDGASAMPPSGSAATGRIDALYHAQTRLLRWIATWNGLSGAISGVRFHGPAEEGQVAPATMIWPAPFGPRYEGRATLTPEQAADLLAGRWYLNVTTPAHPGGEIRGQLRVVN